MENSVAKNAASGDIDPIINGTDVGAEPTTTLREILHRLQTVESSTIEEIYLIIIDDEYVRPVPEPEVEAPKPERVRPKPVVGGIRNRIQKMIQSIALGAAAFSSAAQIPTRAEEAPQSQSVKAEHEDPQHVGEVVDEAHSEKMTEAAREYFRENLKENREKATIFKEMLPIIELFEQRANVVIIVCKCMDGRTQTNEHKWLPPTSAINRRSHGGKINVDYDNRELWNVLHNAINKHPNATLIVIHAAHRSDEKDSGCAAFKEDKDANKPEDVMEKGRFNFAAVDSRARQWMSEQAASLRYWIGQDSSMENLVKNDRVFILSGMTNTNTGAMDLSLEGESIFSAEGIMGGKEVEGQNIIRTPSDVFEGSFLYAPIPEDVEYIGGLTPKVLLDGEDGGDGGDSLFFNKMEVKIAFEAYLMGKLADQREKLEDYLKANSEDQKGKEKPKIGHGIINHEILASIEHYLGDMKNKDAQAFLTYLAAGNLSHATHYRNLNEREKGSPAFKARVFHAELKVAYSETGHDTEERNSLLLIKPSAIDDTTALKIGRDVLIHNLEDLGLKGKLPLLVHINIERDEPIDSEHQLLDVKSRMETKLAIIKRVFGEDVRILTTYSYNRTVAVTEGGVPRTKQFFPYNPHPENKQIIITPEEDVSRTVKEKFDAKELHKLEQEYTDQDTVADAVKVENQPM